MADKESQVKEVETTVEEVEKTKAEEAAPEAEKAVEANGDSENGSEEKESKEDKEEEKNGHDESDKACPIKRKSTGKDVKEDKDEEVVPEKKAKIEEAPAEAESNGDAAEKLFINLVSTDGVDFTVTLEVAFCFNTIKNMVDILGFDEMDKATPLPISVAADILQKVLEWAFHQKQPKPEEKEINKYEYNYREDYKKPLTKWEIKYLDSFDEKKILKLAAAADYLDSKELLALASVKIASLLRENVKITG